MLGTALLAYSLGLRHAVDADHIAAIDNVTRKLMQEGKHPTSIGFWFAFGHSLILFLAALAIAAASNTLPSRFGSLLAPWNDVGAIVRTSVSTLFLFVVAGTNLFILAGVWRTFRRVPHDGEFALQDARMALNTGGLLTRLFKPVFGLVSKDWHMLPLGFLFGLSFDTASEIGLLGISGTQAGEGMPVWLIMVFPALFAAGMALIDTTDGVLMLGAYNWAFINPRRKLYYNFVITAISVSVAVLIGSVEALSLAGDELAAGKILARHQRAQRQFQYARPRHHWRVCPGLGRLPDCLPLWRRRRLGSRRTEALPQRLGRPTVPAHLSRIRPWQSRSCLAR